MSIDRYMDTYFADRATHPIVEVEPDHACQEFAPAPGVRIFAPERAGDVHHQSVQGGPDLASARALVGELLRP